MAKTRNKPVPRPSAKLAPAATADSRQQQLAARGLLLLGALIAAAIVLGGAWLFSTSFAGGRLMPTPVGVGFIMMLLGSLGCWAGLYAARHGRLEGGKLRFDAQAYDLLMSPPFIRLLKVAAHTTGIVVLGVSWMAAYYPQGFAL